MTTRKHRGFNSTFAIAIAALAALPATSFADAPFTWTTDGSTAVDSTSYVKIADDMGSGAEGWRCAAFSTAEGDFAVTSNRLWASATAVSAIGALPAGSYIHQISSAARCDGTATKSIRVQLAQPTGSTALYARITAVTTATGDYSTIPDLRSYMNEVGSLTDAATLAANAVTSITVAPVGDGTDSYTYTASAHPASLGGGAVRFEYDGSGAITRLVVAPTAGRTVELKGDTLAFAAGGVLAHGGQGTVVISQNMAGVDGLVVTNASGASAFLLYDGDTDGGWINANSFTTVYRNVDLDDIEPVEVDNATGSNSRTFKGSNPQVCGIYNVMRDTVDGVKQLRAQVQVAQGGYVKYCKLLLKQDGADVVGRNLEAIAAKDTSLLGQDFGHLANVVARKPSLLGNVEWAPQNALGSDNTGANGYGYGIYRLKSRRIGGLPVLYVGGDVTGLGGAFKVAGNVDVRGSGATAFKSGSMASAPTFAIDGSLTIPNRNHNLGTAVSGTGGILNVVATQPVTDNPTNSFLRGFATFTAQNVDNGTSYIRALTDLVDVEGVMAGAYMGVVNPSTGFSNKATMYHLKVETNGWNDISATCQMQAQNEKSYIRCVKLKFQQSDFNVKVSFVTNYQAKVADGAAFGMDFDNPGSVPVSGGTTSAITATTASKGYSVSNLTCRFSAPGEFLLTLSGANTVTDGRLVVKGTAGGGRATAVLNNVSGLPANGIVDVADGGALVFSGGAGTGMNGNDKTTQNSTAKLRVHAGGILRKWAHYVSSTASDKRSHWAIYRAQDIFLDGGVFEPAYLWKASESQCYTYANNVTLRNGASFKGYVTLWAGIGGDTDPAPHWYVTGSSPSSCDIPLQFVGGSSTKTDNYHEFILDVEDTTGDDTADFAFNKKVEVLSSNSHFSLGKFGGGIAEARAAFSVPNGVTVYDGAFRLGASGVADADSLKFALDGGSLAAAAGTANALGPLTVGASGGGISLGEGATLSFAGSSDTEWTAGADVVVSGFAEGAIRFGESGEGLADAQRRRFVTAEGAKLYVNAGGYLTASAPAFVLVLR